MPIVRIVSPREVTFDIYQRVEEKIDAEHNPPEGLIMHTASVVDGKLKVVDVWESEEHAQRFGAERLGPAIMEVAGDQVGGPPEPDQVEIYEIKAMVLPQRTAAQAG
jgi:hypothetical protein